ncbi:MAG: kelch repeat-containing protein [Myxococcaceae bacterium]|nr:kelch repeat-containing protein [Myxococcaceae bacterium]
MSSSWRVVASFAWALLGACAFDDGVPAGRTVGCRLSAECPAGHACRTLGSRRTCSSLDRPLLDAKVTPQLAGPGTRVTARFTPTSDVSSIDGLVLVPTNGTSRPFESLVQTSDGEVVASIDVVASDGDGPAAVVADFALSPSRAALGVLIGSVQVDVTAPTVATASLSLGPTDENALARAGRADLLTDVGTGTLVRVTIEADEPLARAAIEAVGPSGQRVALAPAPGSSNARVAIAEVTWSLVSAGVDGDWRVDVTLTDPTGNERLVSDALRFRVDLTPPPPPDVAATGGVVFRRAPLGDLESDAGTFSLSAATGVFTEAVVVSVFGDGIPVASGVVRDGGLERLALPLSRDLPTVQVRSVDAAGNRSALVTVREVEWVVVPGRGNTTLTFKPASEPRRSGPSDIRADLPVEGLGALAWEELDRPLDVRPEGLAFNGRLAQVTGVNSYGGAFAVNEPDPRTPVQGEVAAARAGFLADGQVSVGGLLPDGGVSGLVIGFPSDGGAVPPPRAFARLAMDERRDELVLFGGRGRNGPLSDTWVLTTRGWSQRLPTMAPPPLEAPAMAWDSLDEVVLLHGGRLGDGGLSNELWAWNGVTWTSRGTQGPPLANHTLVRDPVRRRLFLGVARDRLLELVDGGAQVTGVDGLAGSRLGPLSTAARCFDVRGQRHQFMGGVFLYDADENTFSDTSNRLVSWNGAVMEASEEVSGLPSVGLTSLGTSVRSRASCADGRLRYFTNGQAFEIDAGRGVLLGSPAPAVESFAIIDALDGGLIGVRFEANALELARGPASPGWAVVGSLPLPPPDGGVSTTLVRSLLGAAEATIAGSFGTAWVRVDTSVPTLLRVEATRRVLWRVVDPDRGVDLAGVEVDAAQGPLRSRFRVVDLTTGAQRDVAPPLGFLTPHPVRLSNTNGPIDYPDTGPFVHPPTGELFWFTQSRVGPAASRLHRLDQSRAWPAALQAELSIPADLRGVEWLGWSSRGSAGADGLDAVGVPQVGLVLAAFVFDHLRPIGPPVLAPSTSPIAFSTAVDDPALARMQFRNRADAVFRLETRGATSGSAARLRVDRWELSLRYRRPPP